MFASAPLYVSLGVNNMKRYVYYSKGKSWANSQELCRSKHTDMATVSNQADNSDIAALPKTWPPNNVWIGLFKDSWMWSDGSKKPFRYWLPDSQYWGNCASVAVPHEGRWVKTECNQKSTFVCQGGESLVVIIIF